MDSPEYDFTIKAVNIRERVVSLSDSDVIEGYRKEIVGFHKQMYDFHDSRDPMEIMCKLSAISARVSWLRTSIIDKPSPLCNRLRIDHIDPCLAEVDRQFKIWSRISTLTRDEYDMSRGQ